MATTTTTLSLRAAAAHLGMSTDTLRKRLQRGLTPGRKVDGAWVVDVLDSPGPAPDNQDGPGPVQDMSGPPLSGLAIQRAEEMAAYTERLLAPWRTIVQTQAEEIGTLKAQLAATTSMNGQAETQHDAAPEWPERRRWWQRLVWG